MITGAIFDMDGVLVDSMPIWDQASALYLQSENRETKEDLNQVLYTKSMMEGAKYLAAEYDLPYTPQEILEGMVTLMERYYAQVIPPKEGVLSFLQKLQEHHVRITVATSSDRILAETIFRKYGMDAYIEKIFTCREVGKSKEHPLIYEMAQEYMQTPKESTWVFEDAYHGLCTAKKAGFKTVGLYDVSSEKYQDILKKEAHIYTKDLTDFEKIYAMASQKDSVMA